MAPRPRRLRPLLGILTASCTIAVASISVAASASAITRSTGTSPTPLSRLQHTLQRDLTRTTRKGSALVYDETTHQTLFSYRASTGRMPASVEKLYTTSTALLQFGPGAQLQTSIYGVGTLAADGTWKGTLYLRGGGDPTFGDSHFDHVMYGTGATVQTLVSRLKHQGIKRVEGRIVGDESYFDSLRGGPDSGYQANLETEGELSALAYDAGFTNGYEDALQPRPALWATQALASVMRRNGIGVPKSTKLRTGVTPVGARLIVDEGSPPMRELVALTNSPSDNFFAEMLLKGIGARYGAGGTTADGAAVVRSVIASRLGLHPRLDDGSGLSRYDRTSPAQVVSLLRQMQGDQAFYNSLSIAGVRGTMIYEMLGTRAVNNCRGKTGTLHDVASLVGYCRARNGDQLVFAYLMNGLRDSTYGHEVEDKMGIALANYRG